MQIRPPAHIITYLIKVYARIIRCDLITFLLCVAVQDEAVLDILNLKGLGYLRI